jgi:hypothetical protein
MDPLLLEAMREVDALTPACPPIAPPSLDAIAPKPGEVVRLDMTANALMSLVWASSQSANNDISSLERARLMQNSPCRNAGIGLANQARSRK